MRRLVTVILLSVLSLHGSTALAEKGEKEAYFDKAAAGWEEMSHHNISELERIAEILPSFGLQEGEIVLYAGCGTGRLIPFLSEKVGRDGLVYGLDFSEEMLKIAQQKNFQGNVTFIKADITNMPLASESINRTICFCTFPHIDNKQAALREFFRVLKPGGVLIICNLLGSKELNTLHKGMGGAVAEDTSPDAQEMERLLLENNFVPLKMLDSPTLYFMQAVKPGL